MLRIVPKETHVHLGHDHFKHYENGKEASRLLKPAIDNLINHGTAILITVPADINFLDGGYNLPDFMLGLYEEPLIALKQAHFADLKRPQKAELHSVPNQNDPEISIEIIASKLESLFNKTSDLYLDFRRYFNDNFHLGFEHDNAPIERVRYDNNHGLLLDERPMTNTDKNRAYITENFFKAFDTLCLSDFDLKNHHEHLIADSQQHKIDTINKRLRELRHN